MTIAELHGKLSSTGTNADDKLEDLLTSDVFGAFRYLPPTQGIVPFLNRVLEDNGATLRIPVTGAEERIRAQYHFWPKGRLLGREPDVLVLVVVGRVQYAFTLEAKYRSGPSDIKNDDDRDSEELSDPIEYGLQLADQYRDLFQKSPYKDDSIRIRAMPEHRFLVYITAHPARPESTLEKSLAQLESGAGDRVRQRPFSERHLLWTNWHSVCQFLSESQFSSFPFAMICDDLKQLLVRKGFKAFTGFSDTTMELPESGRFWTQGWFDLPDDHIGMDSAKFYQTGS